MNLKQKLFEAAKPYLKGVMLSEEWSEGNSFYYAPDNSYKVKMQTGFDTQFAPIADRVFDYVAACEAEEDRKYETTYSKDQMEEEIEDYLKRTYGGDATFMTGETEVIEKEAAHLGDRIIMQAEFTFTKQFHHKAGESWSETFLAYHEADDLDDDDQFSYEDDEYDYEDDDDFDLDDDFDDYRESVKEGVESSKEIIAANSTSFDQMGMANSKPGEFAPGEITDQQNLINTAKMSNDTDFSNKVDDCKDLHTSISIEVVKPLEDVVNLGDNSLSHALEDDEDEKEHHEHGHHHHHHHHEDRGFGRLADIFEAAKKESFKSLQESDYAGNLSYNPDKRLNSSDVLNAVKNAVEPELAAKLSVVKNVDANEEPSYTIQNAEEKDLPEKLEIDTNTDKKVVLKRDGKSYKFDK